MSRASGLTGTSMRIGAVVVLAGLSAWALAPDAGARSRNAQREARIELGRRLFQDPVASRGGQFSCADCHDPEHGFSDPRQVSVDENGPTSRHSQPSVDLAGDGFHWDGEFDTVEQLLVARLGMAQDALEQQVERLDTRLAAAEAAGGPVDRRTYDVRRAASRPPYYGKQGSRPTAGPPVVARLDLDGRYEEGFLRAYGSRQIRADRVVDAVAAYLDTLKTTENAYDRHRRGAADALTPSAKRGLGLFEGRAGCATCHVTRGRGGRLLSDGAFHDTGVAYRAQIGALLPSVLPPQEMSLNAPRDAGRAGQTFQPSRHLASFKTPSLRDVALRPPYMHDGSLRTLEEVVDYYDRGGTPNEHLDEAVVPLHLTDGQKADLVAFLESLTGEERVGLAPRPRYRPDETRVQIRDLHGEPLADRVVRVIPAGDRLRGTDAMPEPFEVTTDAWGRVAFEFPLSTQVRLETDGYEIGLSRLIPDWSRKVDLTATPLDTISVLVRRATSTALPDRITLQPMAGRGQTSDAVISMRRVQRIDSDTSLYAVPREKALVGRATQVSVLLSMTGHPSQTFVLDLRGGQAEPFDMRRDATSPIGLPGVRDERATTQASGSLPARPRGRSGPREATRPELPTSSPGGAAGDR